VILFIPDDCVGDHGQPVSDDEKLSVLGENSRLIESLLAQSVRYLFVGAMLCGGAHQGRADLLVLQ